MAKTDKWQTRPLVREGAPPKDKTVTLKKKSLVKCPRRGSTPRHTDWLTVGRNVTLTLTKTRKSARSCLVLISSAEEMSVSVLSIKSNWDIQYLYSASHSRVAPENVGLQKEQKCNNLHVIPVMKCGCVFWEFAKRKLATRKDKIKIIKSLPLALSVSREERCDVLACHQTVQQTSSGNS
jgi:hypothetical protein